ncbi:MULTISPECIES: hypothetical protein [unclassified Pseudonocardia]|uniref:hypothetical protein n=1 Tax=unclassified Pseudonocardia TaxID=2619320 RepID=UPI00094ABE63|nr:MULTISPECIES: hypothetical protein [unclassified Pseudonocardia]
MLDPLDQLPGDPDALGAPPGEPGQHRGGVDLVHDDRGRGPVVRGHLQRPGAGERTVVGQHDVGGEVYPAVVGELGDQGGQ